MVHVHITSVGHSGSSLLNLILGAHSQVFSVGEIWSLQEFWDWDRCACGNRLKQCAFWGEVTQQICDHLRCERENLSVEYPMRAGALVRRNGKTVLSPTDLLIAHSRGKIPFPLSMLSGFKSSLHATRNNLIYLDTVSKISKRNIIVDSSKNPIRIKLLYLVDPKHVRVIHMVRDGRGVANSWVKAYDGYTFRNASIQWFFRDRLISYMMRNIPSSSRFFLKYEDLCSDPEETVKKICEFIGINFESQMMQFQEQERHDVHINPGPLRAAGRKIKLDERWRTEVLNRDLKRLPWYVVNLNHKYGYTH